MKRKYLSLYYIILMLICPVLPVGAMSEEQKTGVVDYCETIKDNLKKVQKQDARTRIYLGGYYETILTKFVMPLNLGLVENNLSAPDLIENQSKMAETRTNFVDNYVRYQQELEELVGMDCRERPEEFYAQLILVRKGRKKVEQDVIKMRSLVAEHVELVNKLRGKL